ncbi:ComEC/Rec2 family competence protein [Paenibacillus riograndensis]|uniref:DNA internalization-like competence protein ComEC/Rec2 n=1 Tax=Paenibacillus riograndensis SBR5 TaxID=1073571 RepID=A0A0E3WIU5_9BACL|nr:ComEC/Rec2 family competence protein [Paenibacillus riograndensis]CQR57648.1 DNA internalization-like competence protein ComEC/Rec2 [Paenibacillus riograndensis SBR5]
MKKRPLLSFTVCWVIGSAAGCLFSGYKLLIYTAGCLLLLAICAVSGRSGWKISVMLGLSLVAATLYWEWNEGRNVSLLPLAFGQSTAELNESYVTAEGQIVSPVERDGDRVDFTVKLSRMGLDRKKVEGELIAVQITLQAESEIAVAAGWKRGDRVAVQGELKQPGEARNFGGFDYRAYLLTQRIHWLLKGEGTASVQAVPPDSWGLSSILRWNDDVRAALGAGMDRLFREPHAGYMKGLVLGLQDDLDEETFKQFSQLGLTHILAISGMHVAVVVGVILFILRRLHFTRETALTVTIVLIPIYVLLSGAGPSIVRAGIMSMIALLAARFGILKDGMNILAAAALMMLVWNPYLLLSVSFQLSFLVTAGLMVYVPLVNPLLCRLPRWLSSTVSVTLVAQLVSFPLTVYYFNQFSLLSFAANLLFVPFITFLVLPLGTAALLLGRFWQAGAGVLAHAAELMNDATFSAVGWMNGFSGGVLIWSSPSLLWICSYYGLLYGILYAMKRRAEARLAPQVMEDETKPLTKLDQPQDSRGRRVRDAGIWSGAGGNLQPTPFQMPESMRWSGPSALLCAVGLALLLYRGYHSEQLGGAGAISYLDVGQGDSILITTPGGAHILVDGGGTVSFGKKEAWRVRRSPFEVGAKTLLPLLKQRGIHRLDAIILTHGDQDHAGGLQAVLEGMPVSALLFNGTLAKGDSYSKLMNTALAAGVRLYPVQQGQALAPDDKTELMFLWPDPHKAGEAKLPEVEDQNHKSVAFRLEMNGRSFLFTGDMDKAAEEAILLDVKKAGAIQGGPIDVLKVAHHGSKTATGADWLEFWNPGAAVISAGVNNLYGHPNGDVLRRLADSSTAVYRTDLQGEIQMEVRREGIAVRHKLEPETEMQE